MTWTEKLACWLLMLPVLVIMLVPPVARACQELPVGPRLAVTVAAVMGFVWAWFRTREGGTDERL